MIEHIDGIVVVPDGREVGFADYGPSEGTAVLWCHGAPGSRLEPAREAARAQGAGVRLIGIDRPGYGRSAPHPGRTIGGWVPEALAVADDLGVGRFGALGVSTGGAYALALAALCPERVLGVVVCCGLSDMRWSQGKAAMPWVANRALWEAPDRQAALAAAAQAWGADGSKTPDPPAPLPPADLALLSDPRLLQSYAEAGPAMWANGVEGYTDDRLADGPGWASFDVASIRCPVLVIHGGSDSILPPAHAHHTAGIVPHAGLRIFEADGHLSVIRRAVPTMAEILATTPPA